MVEEYESIMKNNVWEVVPRPTDKLVVRLRWIFKVKHAENKTIEKYKAIFVAKGLSQAKGIDYEETFSPVASYLTRLGFTKSEADANLYHILVEVRLLIIVLYVDDLILTGDEQLINSCKDFVREFEMKDMGIVHYFLRLEVWQDNGELFVSQGRYATNILQRFHMESCKPVETPLATNWRKENSTSGEEVDATIYRQLVGSLMHLLNTRPNMCYAIN
eukprot:PITA_21825